jgi:probable DNA metabolism protein
MKYSLCELFSILDTTDTKDFCEPPELCSSGNLSGELFSGTLLPPGTNEKDAKIISAFYSSLGVDFSLLPNVGQRLFELSVNAFETFILTWMSELPLEAAAIRYGRKVINASNRHEAERIANNHSDDDVRLVLDTVYKVRHEINRMQGLLRFSPSAPFIGKLHNCSNAAVRYIAHCEPDYFILPALGEHFSQRFGTTPWAIIDDKRGLCLDYFSVEQPGLYCISPEAGECYDIHAETDQWEKLWRSYHQVITNESRKNTGLQRQFLPKRYWKNLPEMKSER